MELSEFERLILRFFYKQDMNLLPLINGPERFELRKAALTRLKELGYLIEVRPFEFKISHEGHLIIDHEDEELYN
jgi:hypothetical protein